MMFLVDASSNSGASSQGIVLRNKVPLKKRGEKGNTNFSQEKSSTAMEELDFEREMEELDFERDVCFHF